MRWRDVAIMAALPLVVACGPEQVNSSSDDECTSHYEPVADAPTRAALRQKLLHAVDPQVRSLRVVDKVPDDGKATVNLLNRRQLVVMSLDMWQQDDGTWTARRWAQCID